MRLHLTRRIRADDGVRRWTLIPGVPKLGIETDWGVGALGRFCWIAAAVAGLIGLASAAAADTVSVGAMAQVQRAVYGVPPQGHQQVKRQGDAVVFQEELETVDDAAALVRFIDDSTLALAPIPRS